MAFNYPNIVNDAIDTWLNGLLAKLKQVINSFPGSQLVASSVTVDKLAKSKARTSPICFSYGPGALINANVANIFSRTMLNSDGAAASYNIVGWSVSVNNYAGSAALTKSVTATLTFKKNGGAPFLTIDISTSAASLAVGTPLASDLSGAPLSLSSGDVLTVDYNWATTAGASYPALEVVLDTTLQHAGT